MSLRSHLRGTIERALCALPSRTRGGDRLVLAYHNVVPAQWGPGGDGSLHLSIDRFVEQIRLIREEADIVPLMELLTTFESKRKRVAITFDDAYASALEIGVRTCVVAKAPCTVFVTPGLLGCVPYWDQAANAGAWSTNDREYFLWQQRGMPPEGELTAGTSADTVLRIADDAQLGQLANQPLVSIGNHTMQHYNLGALKSHEADAEIISAGQWLRQRFPTQYVPVLAYPFGMSATGAGLSDWYKEIEFALCVTGGWIPADVSPERTQVPRWNVPAGVSADGFRLRLRGRLGSRRNVYARSAR